MLNNDAVVDAAEAHGMLAGMLCVDDGADPRQWLGAVFGQHKEALNESEQSLLFELCKETWWCLTEFDFSFELFLPGDDSSLRERAHALGEWCQGFLCGLGYELGDSEWPGDCSDVLRDLSDVSQLDANAAGEADQEAFMEISEFVRAGVQLIYGEFQRHKPARPH